MFRPIAKTKTISYNSAMRSFRLIYFKIIFPFVLLFITACVPPAMGPQTQFVLGTFCTINLFEQGRPELYNRLFWRLRELEDIFSANREDTDLYRVNQNAGIKPVIVRLELIEVLSFAIKYAEKSEALFDPSIGPLVRLWGIGSDEKRIPSESEILNALGLVNFRDIKINPEEKSVFLKREGMSLDLGGIAKGFAADELIRLLRQEGVERAIIDLGGDLFVLGGRRERASGVETYWRIGIQDPRKDRGQFLGILQVKNKSIATSGTYERFFEADGRRFHHILSTENGFPVENGLVSVTVTADSGIEADALSIAAFVLGWERGQELINSVPGAEGLFVFDDLSLRLTAGFERQFTLSAADFSILR